MNNKPRSEVLESNGMMLVKVVNGQVVISEAEVDSHGQPASPDMIEALFLLYR